jgi:predicted short-subunit dehydrogenase-like oxidoreductase (DUF2520 family)
MRQVPISAAPPLGIVGNGRVALHFHNYFKLLGLPTSVWSRNKRGPSPPDALASCQTILILIPDGEIVPFVDAWPALQEKRLVHCSGRLVTAVAEGAHPLMTFGPALYDLTAYREIPFILDSGGTPFSTLLPGLPNPSFAISAADRPYYHAMCVIAGNFSTILWVKLFDELKSRFGLPASVAHPYLKQIATNLITNSDGALTGPLARDDTKTIESNLRALEGDPYHAVYAAFKRVYEERS